MKSRFGLMAVAFSVSALRLLACSCVDSNPSSCQVPVGDIIVRAEIDPEFAAQVQMGQKATIHDSANTGRVWRGKVTYVADAFLPRRDTGTGIPNLMQPQQENVLECRVTLDAGQSPLPFIGQKVRVYLGSDR